MKNWIKIILDEIKPHHIFIIMFLMGLIGTIVEPSFSSLMVMFFSIFGLIGLIVIEIK